MSTAISSTTQLDRAAQQKLLAARQHASPQGQTQGAAFAQLLSLACDEDTDPDARLRQRSARLDAGDTPEPSDSTDKAAEPSTGQSRRKTAQAAEDAATSEAPTTAAAAVANAQLLALLERAGQDSRSGDAAASAANTAATSAAAGTAAASNKDGEGRAETTVLDSAVRPLGSDGASDLASALQRGRPEGTPSADAISDDKAAAGRPQTPPGRAVSELARLLGGATQAQGGGHGLPQVPAHASGSTADATSAALAQSLSATPALAQADAARVPDAASWQAQAHRMGAPGAEPTTEVGAEDSAPGLELVSGGTEAPARLTGAGSAEAGGQPQGGPGGDPLASTDSAGNATPDAQATAGEAWQQPWQDAMEQLNHQISYWMGQGVRQANLRVGSGAEQAMDVKLSMKNGKAEIEFRTDHEQARHAIAQGGAEVLRALLAQSGVDLGSVSVGAQGSGGQPGRDEAGAGNRPGALAGPGADTDAGGPVATGLRPRNPSSSGLDLYV